MLRDFKVFGIATRFHRKCKGVPLPPYLRDQLLRASASIALNIAEGAGRRLPKDQRRFYGMAFASVRECEAIFVLEEITSPDLISDLDQLGAILFKLRSP